MKRIIYITSVRLCLLVLVVPILIISCGSVDDGIDQKTTIRFWNGFTGHDGRTMIRLVKQFTAENEDINVRMQRMDWDTYYNKLMITGRNKRAPQVFIIHTETLARFFGTGLLRPLNDLLASSNGIDTSDFDSNVLNATKNDGNYYGLPLDISPLGMFYNKKLFVEAGIVDDQGNARPPTNREEFLEAATKLTKDLDGDGDIDQWGFTFTYFRFNAPAIMNQFGGKSFNADYSRSIINNEGNITALKFCTDLIYKYKLAPHPQDVDAFIGFRQGKIGMIFDGIWMAENFRKQVDLDYGGAPMPLLGTKPSTWAGSHNFCISSNISDKELAAAWRLITFLSEHSLDWAEAGQVPVRKSLRNTERFRNMSVQYEFAKQIPYAEYEAQVPFSFEYLSERRLALDNILHGRKTPEDALRSAEDGINKIIKYHNEKHAGSDGENR